MVSVDILGSVGATIALHEIPGPTSFRGGIRGEQPTCGLFAGAGTLVLTSAADRHPRMIDLHRRVAHPRVTATVTEGPEWRTNSPASAMRLPASCGVPPLTGVSTC